MNSYKHHLYYVILSGLILASDTVGLKADISLNVAMDTSGLSSTSGPYSLYFQLVNNGTNATSGAENRIVIDQVTLGGGAVISNTPTTYGGASGNLAFPPNRVELIDSSFINSFAQQFQPGATLSFIVKLTAHRPAQGPDAFSFSILGTNGLPIPTESRVDEFVRLDLDEKRPALRVFRSDLTNTSHNIPQPSPTMAIVTNVPQFSLGVTASFPTNGTFSLDFPGASFADLFELEASIDLQSWTNLGRRAYIGQPIIFSDTARTNFQSRFYRVKLVKP